MNIASEEDELYEALRLGELEEEEKSDVESIEDIDVTDVEDEFWIFGAWATRWPGGCARAPARSARVDRGRLLLGGHGEKVNKPAKVDNRPGAMAKKVELRQRLLDAVPGSSVLDCFCGVDGAMHEAVWKGAESYVGIDEKYRWGDQRRRYVGDNQRVLRALDLNQFNIFDLDAYGSPWKQMLILAERRDWPKGELCGVAITDGSFRNVAFGFMDSGRAQVLGLGADVAPTAGNDEWLAKRTILVWANRAGVNVRELWQCVSRKGGQKRIYQSALLEGR